jgi:hypothetical protein
LFERVYQPSNPIPNGLVGIATAAYVDAVSATFTQKKIMRKFLVVVCLASAFGIQSRAEAQQGYEFEVYGTQVKQPGAVELELNTNYVASGPRLVDAELFPTHHLLRSSLELSAGLTNYLEAAVYVLGARRDDGHSAFVGNRLRVTAAVPAHFGLPIGLGITQELGYSRPGYAEDKWSYELSPMVSANLGSLSLVLNPSLERAVGTPGPHSIEFEPKGKIAREFGDEGSIALQYYSSLGPIRALDPRSEQIHQLFASVEKELWQRWEVALSYGRGLTAASDRNVIATRIEYNFGH